jgi:glucose/arabinose dehydrogenase
MRAIEGRGGGVVCKRTIFADVQGYLAAALLGAGCSDSLRSERRGPPEFDAAGSGGEHTVQIAGGELYLRSGFNVNLFAERQHGVRTLALGPDGAVFATLSADGEIVRLVDEDGDGVADWMSTVLSGLDYPFGLAFRGDTMYFAEQTTVKRLDPGATAPVTLISDLPGGWHFTRTIVFGPDDMLYVAVGSSCDVCDEAPPRAAVTRYNLDGSNAHTFATGLRNSVGLAFHPTTGELWANNNERENLGDDLPPDRLNILEDGKWYGWPQCYLPGEPNPEYPSADCSRVEPPALTFEAHSAPLGLAFYTGGAFPVEYQGDAFMTYHGSLQRSVPTGAKVVRVRVQDGRPVAIEDFVTGWQLADGSRWARPVGLLVMPDGALLVSDDWGSRIWRVSFGGAAPIGSPGELAVATVTTGSDLDPNGYLVIVDGTLERGIGPNETIRFNGLGAGDHSVGLDGVAANCAVIGDNPRIVTVSGEAVVATTFEVSCTSGGSSGGATGTLEVSTSTTGAELDPDGYTVTVNGTVSAPLATNGTDSGQFSAGDHTLELSGVAPNCTVTGSNPRTVTVPAGGSAATQFDVTCTETEPPPL